MMEAYAPVYLKLGYQSLEGAQKLKACKNWSPELGIFLV